MDSFLHWYSEHNKIIIQTLTVLIGLGFIYLFYRIFFLEKQEQLVNEEKNENKIDVIDRKVTSIMDAVSGGKVSVSANPATETEPKAATEEKKSEPVAQATEAAKETVAAGDTNVTNVVDETITKENSQLKEKINQKNSEIDKLKSENESLKVKLQNATSQKTTTFVDGANTEANPELQAELDELKKKLNEYEIIADDIAELQNLRQELAALKAGDSKANA